jgi:hypothetical protein
LGDPATGLPAERSRLDARRGRSAPDATIGAHALSRMTIHELGWNVCNSYWQMKDFLG